MRSWFARRPVTPNGADGSETVEAYREGRRDENARVARDGAPDRTARTDLNEAYQRGRRDERARRRGSPLLSFLVLVVVLIGAGLIYLAVRNGSFSNGGAVVDRSLSRVTQTAQAPILGAEDTAGNVLQNAGQNLKQNAGTAQH